MTTTHFEELREDYTEKWRKEEEKERERMIETAKKDIASIRESLQPYGEEEDQEKMFFV